MKRWTADAFERQCIINFGCGLVLAMGKIAFVGVVHGWTVDTFRRADWGFLYGWCGGTATLWLILRIRRAISN